MLVRFGKVNNRELIRPISFASVYSLFSPFTLSSFPRYAQQFFSNDYSTIDIYIHIACIRLTVAIKLTTGRGFLNRASSVILLDRRSGKIASKLGRKFEATDNKEKTKNTGQFILYLSFDKPLLSFY